MTCQHCESSTVVKNGSSRHGRQRWLCLTCGRTSGERDHRRVEPQKKASALAHYLEGVGLRATERLVGVSHNSVMNWALEAVEGKAHTFTIESHNNRLRVYLARLRRKTHCYTKKLANLAASILLYLLTKF